MTAKHAKTLPSIAKGKRGVGRPTVYPQSPQARRKLLDAVIAYGEQGYSETEIAVAIGVERSTLKAWGSPNNVNGVAEFIPALARAKESAQAWWESKARRGDIGTEPGMINAQAFKFVLASRYRSDYAERPQIYTPGQAGAGAKVEINYIMAPNTQAPPVQLHSHQSEPVTIDIEGDEV